MPVGASFVHMIDTTQDSDAQGQQHKRSQLYPAELTSMPAGMRKIQCFWYQGLSSGGGVFLGLGDPSLLPAAPCCASGYSMWAADIPAAPEPGKAAAFCSTASEFIC